MLMFQTQHLTAQQVTSITKLHDGEFDTAVLTVLVTKLATSFEHYAPDKQVMSYLHQHHRAMQINEPLDFTHSKDKRNGDDRMDDRKKDSKKRNREEKRSKSKREKPSKERLEHKKRKLNKIPVKLQCKRAQCVERGNHLNHTHKDCRFKGDNTPKKHPHMDRKHPNLGKAPPKGHKTFGTNKSKTTVNTSKRSNRRGTTTLLYLQQHLAPSERLSSKGNSQDKLEEKIKQQQKLYGFMATASQNT